MFRTENGGDGVGMGFELDMRDALWLTAVCQACSKLTGLWNPQYSLLATDPPAFAQVAVVCVHRLSSHYEGRKEANGEHWKGREAGGGLKRT